MSWHGCPVSELVPGLPLTCLPRLPAPPPVPSHPIPSLLRLLLLLRGAGRADRPDGALGVPAGASCKGRYPRWRTPVLTRAPQLPQCIWCSPADPSWGNEALTLRRNAPSVALREALIAERRHCQMTLGSAVVYFNIMAQRVFWLNFLCFSEVFRHSGHSGPVTTNQ